MSARCDGAALSSGQTVGIWSWAWVQAWHHHAMNSATKNFHLPLSEAMYEELRAAAKEADLPATKFAQDLMRAGLDEWRRVRRRVEIAAYARQVAGSSEDLDPDLEREGIKAMVDKR